MITIDTEYCAAMMPIKIQHASPLICMLLSRQTPPQLEAEGLVNIMNDCRSKGFVVWLTLMALSVPAEATQVPSGWKATVFT